jgi:hypothetical protein
MDPGEAVGVPRPHLEAHDRHHRAEPDLADKGLKHDAVGLLGSVVIALSSVAPAYALTATLAPRLPRSASRRPPSS